MRMTIALLAAEAKIPELELCLRGARNLGFSHSKVEEMMNDIAYYCDWPTALQGFKCVGHVYATIA